MLRSVSFFFPRRGNTASERTLVLLRDKTKHTNRHVLGCGQVLSSYSLVLLRRSRKSSIQFGQLLNVTQHKPLSPRLAGLLEHMSSQSDRIGHSPTSKRRVFDTLTTCNDDPSAHLPHITVKTLIPRRVMVLPVRSTLDGPSPPDDPNSP